jgi:hypothetical protein
MSPHDTSAPAGLVVTRAMQSRGVKIGGSSSGTDAVDGGAIAGGGARVGGQTTGAALVPGRSALPSNRPTITQDA